MASGNLTVTNEEWEEFKKKHNKSYKDDTDEEFRKGLYLESKKKVNAHNEQYETGTVTYKMGMNQFSDLTQEEVAQRTCGLRKPKD